MLEEGSDSVGKMISLPQAFGLAFSQLSEPAILRILAKSLGWTFLIFICFGILAYLGLGAWMERLEWAPASSATALLTVIFVLLAGWLLFRFVALFVLQFFASDVVRAVEAKYYPNEASTARELGFREELGSGLRAGLRALALNLVALPFAIFLLFTGIGAALLFWGVNALLLGRELQDMVWLRHRKDMAETAPLGGSNRFLLGGAVAGLLMLPFVNLLAPVLGAASATHLVHRGRAVVA